MIEPPPSVGQRMDALAGHLSERIDLLAADVSHANVQIAKLELRFKGAIVGIAIMTGMIFAGAALFSDIGKLLW